MRTNTAHECHRKGSGGMELPHGQAGCVCDQSTKLLSLLALVKQLFILGVQLEGVVVQALIASSVPTATSLGLQKAPHFTRCVCLYPVCCCVCVGR